MKRLLMDCINELCLKCGKYRYEHEGFCDGCRWLPIKNEKRDKSMNEAMLECAEELVFYCETEECNGEYKCPFYHNELCDIGGPCDWILKERKKR